MKRRQLPLIALAVAATCLVPTELRAQVDRPPEKGGQTYSLGMPPVYKGHAGVESGAYNLGGDSELLLYATMAVQKDLGSPVVGLGAIGLEGYIGNRGRDLDGGGRALFRIPALHFTIGADYNFRDEALDVLLRLQLPIRRGGIFGHGTQVRIDWLPGRGNTLTLGLDIPLWGRNIGKTRPRKAAVKLDDPPAQKLVLAEPMPELEAPLARVTEGAHAIALLTQPLIDRGGKMPVSKTYAEDLDELKTHLANRSLPAELAAFHLALDRAFSIAAAGADLPEGETTPEGVRISAAARLILLDEVLLRYNRLLGQRKTHDSLDEFSAIGHSVFSRWLLNESGLPAERFRATYYVFQTLVDAAEAIREQLDDRWEDNRFVWIPLQLALKAEDHDTDEEMDAIIERAVKNRFSTGNDVWYVMNEEFQLEMSRSVLLAKDYHVLWIHDFRGDNGHGQPDEMAFRHTLDSYIQALINRVRDYDRTGKLPTYMLFLDQHYFEINKSRMFLRVLKNPMSYELDLPSGFEDWEQELAAKQAELRQAVEESVLLRVQRRQYGEKWLENLISVQINITNPSDFSFSSLHVAGIMPIPDNMIRDHRKIAFYDITEEDPYRGASMFTGMGIGEHYTGPNWEDRAIILKGPGALAVKHAARHLLETQGFEPQEIPWALRPKPFPEGYEQTVADTTADFVAEWGVQPGFVMQLHNETGYQPKPINVAKAILYSLMPAGSILKVPDSLWQSYIYASLLTGSALRGCKVLIFSPTLKSAPSSAGPTMARAYGLMSSILLFRNELQEEISASDGLLKVGFYNPQTGVGDLRGRFLQAREGAAYWTTGISDPNPASQAVLADLDAILEEAGYEDTYLLAADTTLAEGETPESPKLHLKANYFISGASWDALRGHPEWGPVLREYIAYLARQMGTADERIAVTDGAGGLRIAIYDLIRAVREDVTAEQVEKGMAYLTVGSANMDYRSMVMDGEAMIIVTGWSTIIGLIDFMVLPGLSTWIETQEELDELLPPPSGMNRAVANWLKLAL
jgi:hypothetical protein